MRVRQYNCTPYFQYYVIARSLGPSIFVFFNFYFCARDSLEEGRVFNRGVSNSFIVKSQHLPSCMTIKQVSRRPKQLLFTSVNFIRLRVVAKEKFNASQLKSQMRWHGYKIFSNASNAGLPSRMETKLWRREHRKRKR